MHYLINLVFIMRRGNYHTRINNFYDKLYFFLQNC